MFGKKKEAPAPEPPKEKPTPAFLRPDYPYQAVGEAITDIDSIEDEDTVYEIKCHQCEMSIRSQGRNVKGTWKRLQESGCIGCGNKELVVMRVNMDAAAAKEYQ